MNALAHYHCIYSMRYIYRTKCGVPKHMYLDGHSVAALGGDDAVVPVVVHLVVVDGQEVAVVVGVKAVPRVVVHLVPPPVSLLVAVRVDPEMVVVDVRVVNVAVDVDSIKYFWVAPVSAITPNLLIRAIKRLCKCDRYSEDGGDTY